MKKAQASQVFLYAIGIIIVGLVLLLGYKGIASLTSATDKGVFEQFKHELQNDIDSGSSYNRQSTRTYTVPGDYQVMCFADKDQKGVSADTGVAFVDQEIQDNTENNVFLVTTDNEINAFPTDPIKVSGGSLCRRSVP